MDMISKIQLEDALKNKKLVEERVKHVALIFATEMGELNGQPNAKWMLESYLADSRENQTNRNGVLKIPEVRVILKTPFSDRPITEMLGNPEDDDCDYYSTEQSYVHRHIRFPLDYLLSDDSVWMPELREKAEVRRKQNDERKLSDLEESLKRTIDRKTELYDLVAEIKKKLGDSK